MSTREEKVQESEPDRPSPHRDVELVGRVLDELRQLRSSKGAPGPAKLPDFPALYELPSQSGIQEAWQWLKRTSETAAIGNRFMQAATSTVFGPGDDVLDRLTETGSTLGREQRTIRDWSDRGLPYLAQALVEASYLSGSRSQHFVDLEWTMQGRDTAPQHWCLRIFWAGHVHLKSERISVYAVDPSAGPEEDDFSQAGELLMRVTPDWQDIEKPAGAFAIRASLLIHVPHPRRFRYRALTFRFGKQTTQMVRITGMPRFAGVTSRVSTFRQGVTFWFDNNAALPGNDFDWGEPIALKLESDID